MKVFFAPDYRQGVAYQALLAEALAAHGVDVTFPRGHRRVLPLFRGIHGWSGDLLHIHWPEKFFEVRGDGFDFWRKVRYPLDLALVARKIPIILTAHDRRPHNRAGESLLDSNFRRTYAAARAIIVHSQKCADILTTSDGVAHDKLHVIPHGDLYPSLGSLPSRAESRASLGIPPTEKICLMYGTVEPYKGIEPVLDWWRSATPHASLAIAGKPLSPCYAADIRCRAGNSPNIRLDLAWQPDDALKRWLASADCILFHYSSIFTSGAASLARSLGIPILIPRRLDTVDLAEPNPAVIRFDSLETDFSPALQSALALPVDFNAAAAWRHSIAWSQIAIQTAGLYASILGNQII